MGKKNSITTATPSLFRDAHGHVGVSHAVVVLVVAILGAGGMSSLGHAYGNAVAGNVPATASRAAHTLAAPSASAMATSAQAALVPYDLAAEAARIAQPRRWSRFVARLASDFSPTSTKGFASVDLRLPKYVPGVHGVLRGEREFGELIARLLADATDTPIRLATSDTLSRRYRELDSQGRSAYNAHLDGDAYLFTTTLDLRRIRRHGTEVFPTLDEYDVAETFNKSLSSLTDADLRPYGVQPPGGHLVVIPTKLFSFETPIPALAHLDGLVHRAPNFGEGPRIGLQYRFRLQRR